MTRRTKSRTLDEARQRLKEALTGLERAADSQHNQLHDTERELLEAKTRANAFKDELTQTKSAFEREKQAREKAAAALNGVEARLDEMAGEVLSILQRSGS